MSDTLYDRVNAASAPARAAWKAGDLDRAETFFLDVWAMIEAEETDATDLHQQMSSGLVTFFRQTGQYDKAYTWLEIMSRYYENDAKSDFYVELLRALIDYDSGNLDRAFDGFAALHARYGNRMFVGEDPKYLRFFESRT